jgi:hypothetical protein
MDRYVVTIRAARSRKWGQATVIRVLDTTAGPSEWYWVRRGVVAQWGETYARQGRALDARYTGPRSAYGQALAAAEAMVATLNAEAR